MSIKAFFKDVARAEHRITVLTARLEHYKSMGLSVTTHLDAVGGSHARNGSSKVEEAVVGMTDMVESIQEELARYREIVKEAEDLIAKVPQERYRMLLELHYLCGRSLRSISDDLGYTDYNSIYQAHGWALQTADRIAREEMNDGHTDGTG